MDGLGVLVGNGRHGYILCGRATRGLVNVIKQNSNLRP
jgi:hypothetical protein